MGDMYAYEMQPKFNLALNFDTCSTNLLLFCAPVEPNALWTHFHDDDLHHKLYQLGCTVVMQKKIYNFGLHLINNILHDSGHALSDFPSMSQSQLN